MTIKNAIKEFRSVGVVAVNSIDYLQIVLGNLSTGVISVPLRSADDDERIDRIGLAEIVSPGNDAGWLSAPFISEGGDAPAQISFTSGTEGAPKAVLLSRGNLHDVVERLTQAMEINSDIREYVGVPVYHSFGYGRARAVLNAGGKIFVPQAGFNLSEIREMAAAGEINAVSAVPSLWRLMLQNTAYFGDALADIRWAEIGSQFMAASEKEALRAMLPNAKIVQHYGLTEASRSTLLRIDQSDDAALYSVGRVGDDVRVDIDDDGLIRISGPNVALGIDDAQRYSATDKNGWLTTSDKGHIENGYLYFDGRADDLINCGGIKISPEKMETEVRDDIGEVGDFAIARAPDEMRGETIQVIMTPASAPRRDDIVRAVTERAAKSGVQIAGALKVREIDELPRTNSGKVRRKLLAEDFSGIVAPAVKGDNEEDASSAFLALFAPGGDLAALSDDASFHSVGADSLTHIQATLMLERSLGASAPRGWEAMPVKTLASKIANASPDQKNSVHGAPPLPDGKTNMNPEDISFWALVKEDFDTHQRDFFSQGFWMLYIHRFGNWRMTVEPKIVRAPVSLIYKVLNKLTQPLFGMKLDYTVKVGRRVKLEHFGGMILGAREIGDDVTIRQNTTFGIRSVDDLNAKPVIGKNVDIGAGAVIVGNIHIGDNSVIGANSVVYASVPANSVVSGVPAKIIGEYNDRNAKA